MDLEICISAEWSFEVPDTKTMKIMAQCQFPSTTVCSEYIVVGFCFTRL